jgi:putative membrane protein
VERVIVVDVAVSFIVIVVLQLLGMFFFHLMTPFDDMEQLRKGNAAVALAMGGQFLATAIVLGTSAYSNSSIWHVALWFAVGYVLLFLTYWIFEWVTPKLHVSEHLLNGNVAVGALLACVYVGMGFTISSLII